MIFYVWEDARVWACWNHSFHTHLSNLEPVSCFHILGSSGLPIGSGCSLMDTRSHRYSFPFWVVWRAGIVDDCDIIHLEPDIVECEVKWVSGSTTMTNASGGNGIPVELLQILRDAAVKVLHSIYQQIWKTQQWPQDWKRSVFIPIPKKGNAKECSN